MSTFVLALVLQAVPAVPAADTVVVCPSDFQAALVPWIEHRKMQGHVIAIVENRPTPALVKSAIRQVAMAGALRYVVLVGDVPQGPQATARRCVPTCYVSSKVGARFGSEQELASDNGYADLDNDEVPDVAVGRLTADTPAELTTIIGKIIRYEQSASFGPWRSRINFVAGVGGFGALTDSLVESAMRRLIAAGVPPEYSTSMTYASWRSPYCPDPRAFHQTTLDRLNEGCLYWVYMGHSLPRLLEPMRVPGTQHHLFDVRDVAKLNCNEGAAIAIFLSCYAGAFDAPQDCLAEELLRRDGGPVAVVGASRVSMPYAMATLGTGLLDEAFQQRRETLGETLLLAKQKMAQDEQPGHHREMLDAMARLLSPAGWDLEVERREHLHLFNLLGDPLLRVRYPRPMTLDVPSTSMAGRRVSIRGTSPVAGTCTIELVHMRDRLGFKPPVRDRYDDSPDVLAAYQAVYRRANNPRMSAVTIQVKAGSFSTSVQVPADASGPLQIRAYVAGEKDFASGSAKIKVLQQSK